jgi:hypothetical protein
MYFLVFTPIVIAMLATLFAWKSIHNRWLFLASTTLLMLGLQSLFTNVTFTAFAYFLPSQPSTRIIDLTTLRSLLLGVLLQLIFGCPILWRLYKIFKII